MTSIIFMTSIMGFNHKMTFYDENDTLEIQDFDYGLMT